MIGAGRALVGVASEPTELGPGDYLRYPGDVPHVFEALESKTQAVLVTDLNPRVDRRHAAAGSKDRGLFLG